MSRFLRLYEKKRGDRRTGSTAVGNLGEALFFGVFFVVGCVAMAVMVSMFVWPEFRANRQFAKTRCDVVAKRLIEHEPGGEGASVTYLPEVLIRYDAGGHRHYMWTYDVARTFSPDREAMQDVLDRFEIGRHYDCWYDPMDPQTVVLVRGYSGWRYLLLLIPLSFVSIGGGGLLFAAMQWNASAERRSHRAQRAAQLQPFEVPGADPNYPTVPAGGNLTNSPGTTLAYRLPTAAMTGLKLVAVAMAALLWNGIVAIFVVMVVGGFARGEPDWVLTVLVVPFVAIGIGLVVYFARLGWLATAVGPTWVEVSEHPLAPGRACDALLSQAGRLKIDALELWLACDEKATYRQGTDTRIESRRVFEERCFIREDFEIDPSMPFESRCQVQVPGTAMHSFQANHNEVSWKLIVKGRVAGRPDYQRVFQIVVNPGNGNGHS